MTAGDAAGRDAGAAGADASGADDACEPGGIPPIVHAPGTKLLSALPCFVVPNVQVAADRLRDTLGFRICCVVGEPGCEFGIVDLVPGQGFHLKSNGGAEGRRNAENHRQAIDAYIRIADADETFTRLKAAGAEMLSTPTDQAWGMREFGVRDADGMVFCYGADTSVALPSGEVSIAPELVVPDVGRAAAWYQHVLGFDDTDPWGDPPVYAIARRDDVRLHLSAAKPPFEPRPNRTADDIWDVYVECEGVDALCEEFRARGAAIAREPVTQEYQMREFDVLDLDGYVICFGEITDADVG
ncbi:MAG: VOC family protein [Planctomycetota bacterium]